MLGEWHTHGNNYSKNVKIHANALIAVITFHMKNYLNENPKKLRLFNHVLSKNNMIAARILQQGGEFTLSRKFCLKSIKYKKIQIKSWIILFFSIIKIKQ